MRLETSRRQVPTINVSALVDVIFTLLIFLLLAATFTSVGRIDVSLPEAEASAGAAHEGLVVVVPVSGPVTIDGAAVDDEGVGGALAEQAAEHESLLLVADGTVALERAVKVLDAASRAGFSAISIATRPMGAPVRELRKDEDGPSSVDPAAAEQGEAVPAEAERAPTPGRGPPEEGALR